MSVRKPEGPRSVALVGPYLSGKTTLLESILSICGAISRKGTAKEGNTVGDASPEARERKMSTEVNVAGCSFMDDRFAFLDCPGSLEFLQEALNVLPGVDAAVLVCEPDSEKVRALTPLLKALEDSGVPRMIFVNKIDKAMGSTQALLEALQSVSAAPLVLRHMPLVEDEQVTGYVDLASKRSYVYRPNQASETVEVPGQAADAVREARYRMLEKLADFDDALMEKVLDEAEPERDELYQNLTRDFQEGLIVPVLLGAAEVDEGVRRLLKALRHECPPPSVAAARAGAEEGAGALAQVLKTYHTQHGGKLSVARVWAGTLKDGAVLNGERVGGLFRLMGHETQKIAEAGPGDIVGLGRLDKAATGDVLSEGKGAAPELPKAARLEPVYALAVAPERRDDEVKLSGALAKLADEDPALRYDHPEDTNQLVLRGQGDIHLKVALERLRSKYGLAMRSAPPKVPYKEAIRKSTQQHGRHKKQSGGHGQFGDVHIEIRPLPRGGGFEFIDKVVGGAIPRQFIPAVEAGVREYLNHGPLGFPVVDVSVTLYDGQYHAVDSSEMAFKTAARIAMSEGLPKCDPVLLEPIVRVEIVAPSDATSKVNQLVSGRRGQLLGFDARPGWPGWDVVSANMPQSEMQDLIVELRSLTQGVGAYTARFDHLQELSGRLADQAIAQARPQAA